jgi:hypothetical protein
LVPGSEEIYLELEEIERPGTVIKREQLRRGADYEINYDRGSIQFKEAILRTDTGESGEVLRRQIVATYQHESDGRNTNLVAGRARYHFDRGVGRESWIGATAVQENRGSRDLSLYGADVQFKLGNTGKVVAEYAHSRNESEQLGNIVGSAVRIEAESKLGTAIDAKVFYRRAETGFANNSTISFVPGQTRYGAEVRGRVGTTTTLRLAYDHEENKGTAPRPIVTLGDLLSAENEPLPGQRTDNDLTTISAGLEQKLGRATLGSDWVWRDRTDHLNPERAGTSSQLRSRFSYPFTNTLTFKATNETTLSQETDAVYSDRTQLGLDWQIVPGIKLGVNQHFFTRGQFQGQNFTTVDLNGDYALGKATTLTGRYSVLNGLNGMMGQGAVGLKHRWEVSPGFNLDFAYERIVGSLFGKTGAGDRTAQPVAIGQGISTLGLSDGDSFSLGGEYTASPDWKASARFEHRRSNNGPSTNLMASVTGKISPTLTALGRFTYNQASNQNLSGLGPTTNLRAGLAYRNPLDDKFNLLLRYEYRHNNSVIPETILLGSGTGSESHLFATEMIYAPNWRWEFYGKFGVRKSQTFLAEDQVGATTVALGQLRGTYRIHDRFDIGAEARWLGQGSYRETGFLVEGGYYLNPNLRLAAGYAFGKVSDRDFDGTRSASGPYFGVTMKLNELFNGFGLQRATPQSPEGRQPDSARKHFYPI